MGVCIYISEQDRLLKRRVSDKDVNEAFQEALWLDPSLMIEEVLNKVKKGWFNSSRTEEYYYNIYHETPAIDGSAYMARHQLSASGEKRTVLAYLYGIINGCVHLNERLSKIKQ